MKVNRPLIAVTATQRATRDWNGAMTLIQVRVSAQYAEAVYRAGGYPLVTPTFTGYGEAYAAGRGWPEPRPQGLESVVKAAEAIISSVNGLLLTGGGDVLLKEGPGYSKEWPMDRDRDFWEAALFNAAVKYKRPIFGICRGVQLINIALGGTLWDDIPSQYPGAINHQQTTSRNNPSHKVFFAPGSQIAEICGQTELLVNSGHHQAVKDLGKGLVVTARAEDELIEAVELPGPLWIMGVQWHPEALVNGAPVYLTLFERLVQEAKKVRVVESPTKLPPLKTGAVGPLEKPLTERR